MKSARIVRSALTAAIVLAAISACAQTDAQKAFDAIKNLPGTWEQKGPDGKVLQVTFRTVSNGSAVMSEIVVPGEDMISMIHMDGPNKLLLTHYCGAGNQPRMQASVSPDGKTITFNFIDGTSIDPTDSMYMRRMVLTLMDDNHHTEEWMFFNHGKEQKELFDLRRKI